MARHNICQHFAEIPYVLLIVASSMSHSILKHISTSTTEYGNILIIAFANYKNHFTRIAVVFVCLRYDSFYRNNNYWYFRNNTVWIIKHLSVIFVIILCETNSNSLSLSWYQPVIVRETVEHFFSRLAMDNQKNKSQTPHPRWIIITCRKYIIGYEKFCKRIWISQLKLITNKWDNR